MWHQLGHVPVRDREDLRAQIVHLAAELGLSRGVVEEEAKRRGVGGRGGDPTWARWAWLLVPTFAVEVVIAWLEAGQSDQASAARRIGETVLVRHRGGGHLTKERGEQRS